MLEHSRGVVLGGLPPRVSTFNTYKEVKWIGAWQCFCVRFVGRILTLPPPVTPLSIIVCTFGIHVYIGAYINQYSTVCNDELQSNMKYLLIVLAMQLPEAETCINRLIKNEFFVLFMKLLNCKSSFPIHTRLYGKSFMFWFLNIFQVSTEIFLKNRH